MTLSIPPEMDNTAALSLLRLAPQTVVRVVASGCRRISLTGLVAVRLILDRAPASAPIDFYLPESPRAARRLASSGLLADLRLRPLGGAARHGDDSYQGVPLTRLNRTEDVERFAALVHREAARRDVRTASAMAVVAGELGANVVQHAGSGAAIGVFEMSPATDELIVADAGVGLRARLAAQGRSTRSDIDAVLLAAGVGVDVGVGFGLPAVIGRVRASRTLMFFLRSGLGGLVAGPGADQELEEHGDPTRGTWAVMRVSRVKK